MKEKNNIKQSLSHEYSIGVCFVAARPGTNCRFFRARNSSLDSLF